MKVEVVVKIDNEDGELKEAIFRDMRKYLWEFFGEVEGTLTVNGETRSISMPECPHCGRRLDHLENEQDLIVSWIMYPDGEYSPVPEFEKMHHIGDVNKWVCPYCGKKIADDEKDAIDFFGW